MHEKGSEGFRAFFFFTILYLKFYVRTKLSFFTMKKISTLIIGTLLSVGAMAQNVVNGSFEVWADSASYSVPRDWNSNARDYFLSGLTVEPTTDAYSGDSAAIVRTIDAGGVAGLIGGILTNGSIRNDSLGYHGWGISYRPQKLTGYYKYSPAIGDSARVILSMYIRDQDNNRDSLVATGNIALATAVDYTYFEFPILNAQPNVTGTPIPSTYVILITSTKDLANPMLSELTIDNLNFEGVVSTPEVASVTDLSVYPNPVEDHFVIKSPTHRVLDVAVLNTEGRQVQRLEATSGANDLRVQTNHLAKGFYYVQIRFENGAIETRFITVVK